MISSRPDPTLQDIVYKIVPDLYESKLTTVNTCNYSNGLCQAACQCRYSNKTTREPPTLKNLQTSAAINYKLYNRCIQKMAVNLCTMHNPLRVEHY
jgi:hypothetical protein